MWRRMPRVPLLATLGSYDRRHLRGDLTAGATTAVMLIPQAMAYAMLAGLPPIYGLYSALVPVAVYAFFGSSRQLAVGPVAMVSLLVAAGVGELAPVGSATFVSYAILLALMVGALQVGMGLFRLGFVVNFLSHPVVSGFTSAAAIIIGFSQLQHVLGFSIPRSHHVHEIAIEAWRGLAQTNVATLALASGSIILLGLLKKYASAFPRALAVVAGTTLLVWGLDLSSLGVAVVGRVPAGLPALAMPPLDAPVVGSLAGVALTIALVGFMESIAVAKKYARSHRYRVDANQELIALGSANLLGSFTGSYPVTGGFSRTAVNAQAGAKTAAAGLFTALLVGVALLVLTPVFHFLPKAVLAAIIMTAVFGLIDVREALHLWKIKPSDFAMLALTFAATLLLGIEQGIITGVLASLGLLIARSTRPHIAVLGRVPGSTAYRNLERFPGVDVDEELLALRLDAQIYFGNINFLKETLDTLEDDRPNLRTVVIDASGINQIDASGEAAFREILAGYPGAEHRPAPRQCKRTRPRRVRPLRLHERAGDESLLPVRSRRGSVPPIPQTPTAGPRKRASNPRRSAERRRLLSKGDATMAVVEAIFDTNTYTLTYVVLDPATRDAVVIDPVLDYDRRSSQTSIDSANKLISFVKQNSLKVRWILETHAHADHLTSAQLLKTRLEAPVAVGERITVVQETFKDLLDLTELQTDGSQFDRLLRDGDVLEAGSLRVEAIATPGHTPACMSYKIDDAVFTGDALFMHDYGTGRCDFPGGSAEDLYDSVHGRLYALPDETRVFVGHDYQPGGRRIAWQTTIGKSKEHNPQLKAETSKEDFVRFRTERDVTLNQPNLLFQSIQVNVDAGRLPPEHQNGRRYLRYPLNLFRPSDGLGAPK